MQSAALSLKRVSKNSRVQPQLFFKSTSLHFILNDINNVSATDVRFQYQLSIGLDPLRVLDFLTSLNPLQHLTMSIPAGMTHSNEPSPHFLLSLVFSSNNTIHVFHSHDSSRCLSFGLRGPECLTAPHVRLHLPCISHSSITAWSHMSRMNIWGLGCNGNIVTGCMGRMGSDLNPNRLSVFFSSPWKEAAARSCRRPLD